MHVLRLNAKQSEISNSPASKSAEQAPSQQAFAQTNHADNWNHGYIPWKSSEY